MSPARSGGYDDGYQACDCFWGREPGSLIRMLTGRVGDLTGARVLDVGCGEGKNAAYFGERGAIVHAMDVSPYALANAEKSWGDVSGITWELVDVRDLRANSEAYDIVVAYGLLHCLGSRSEIASVSTTLQTLTRIGGHNVICAFNDRSQDLSAHPGFEPCLAPHSFFDDLYAAWEVPHSSDSDLVEIHPHNQIRHTHSMSRILARKI